MARAERANSTSAAPLCCEREDLPALQTRPAAPGFVLNSRDRERGLPGMVTVQLCTV